MGLGAIVTGGTGGTSEITEIQSAITVNTTTSAKLNGAALIAAYTAAKALLPNGAALTATNRACVIVPPGKYDLDHGTDDACVPLILDTEFVDIIGLTTDRSLQHIYGTPPATNSGVIIQTADDVHISNLTVEIQTAFGTPNLNNTDSAAYFPSTNLSNTVVDNCYFIGKTGSNTLLWSMRAGVLEYSGTFTNCIGGNASFSGYGGTASGTFTSCIGGIYSFGGYGGTASGTFTNCTGGESAFGGYGGTASGTFTNCIGGYASFGGYAGTASGTFTNCTGGIYSFGGGGTASGTFSFCKGSTYSYNNQTPTASVATIALVTGGTGYTADDELIVDGGTGSSAEIKVLTVNAGVILTAKILTIGSYTAKPANAVAVIGGTGYDNATFNITWNEGHIYGCVDDTGFIAELNWDDVA